MKNEEDADNGYAFRLFSGPRAAAQQQRVVIRSPSPEIDGVPRDAYRRTRPVSFYYAAPPAADVKARYAAAALSGGQIREISQKACPGMRYAWRVLAVKVSGKGIAERVMREEASKKQCRKGKVARMKIRKRMQKIAAAEATRSKKDEEDRLAEEAKEVHIREKKTAMNRKKQLRKREKAREAKMGGKTDGADAMVIDVQGEDGKKQLQAD